MKILVTGAAGFIGYHLSLELARQGHEVLGMDNLNSYYDVDLKYGRLSQMGITQSDAVLHEPVYSREYFNYRFVRADLRDKEYIDSLFYNNRFDVVCHLAAQAGVRYSIDDPYTYINSNVMGFLNILEACRHYPVKHLVFASSSSIYGLNTKVPYSEDDKTDTPVSLYAATKKSDELMAHAYCHLYGIPATGLRFFTVYGPWGRPDMAPSLFMDAILQGNPIRVFNHGDMARDFTYIDDIIRGILLVIPSPLASNNPFRVYNIGNSQPVPLMDFIHTIEKVTGKKADCHYTEMQPGDVKETYADTSKLEKDFGYHPSTSLDEGIQKFYEWFSSYRTANQK
jgi:UDP-glucuronate 4-epimerase